MGKTVQDWRESLLTFGRRRKIKVHARGQVLANSNPHEIGRIGGKERWRFQRSGRWRGPCWRDDLTFDSRTDSCAGACYG
jgi:hypothetical protein